MKTTNDNNCYNCKWKKNVPGSSHHVTCTRPLPDMGVNERGVEKGWAFYPLNFDPIWLEPPGDKCRGFVDIDSNGVGNSLREINSHFGPYESTQKGIDDISSYLDSLPISYTDKVLIIKKIYHITSTTLEAIASSYDKVYGNGKKEGEEK